MNNRWSWFSSDLLARWFLGVCVPEFGLRQLFLRYDWYTVLKIEIHVFVDSSFNFVRHLHCILAININNKIKFVSCVQKSQNVTRVKTIFNRFSDWKVGNSFPWYGNVVTLYKGYKNVKEILLNEENLENNTDGRQNFQINDNMSCFRSCRTTPYVHVCSKGNQFQKRNCVWRMVMIFQNSQ